MGFFIKFLYSTFFMPPGIFIVVLALFSLWLYRYYRLHTPAKVLAVFTFIFYITSTQMAADSLIRSLESKHSPPEAISGDVIIMLGGGSTLDTPNINGKGHLSGYAANRLLTAAQLYQKLHVPIIVSGGQVYKTTGCEAEIAKTILIALGIPQEHIIVENKSFNTTENAKFTKEYIDSYNFNRPILVTSAFHMERAVQQFNKVGVAVIPFPTDYQANMYEPFHISKIWPSADAMLNVRLAIKEYLGLLAVKWY